MQSNDRKAEGTIWLLAASVALMMIGYGIAVPVFGRRLGELGGGVEQLGLLTMAFALGQFLFAPVMGGLADRVGRRPLVLLALGGVVVFNLAYLVAPAVWVFILIRFVQGAVTAGLLPATMGVVADTMPETRRAQWMGVVMGAYGVGAIFGPTVGGLLFDTWGFAAPFLASALMGMVALLFALFRLPETRAATRVSGSHQPETGHTTSIWRTAALFGALLALDFVAIFAFAYVDPELVFHFYDVLGFSTTQFGILIGAYGLAQVAGQLTLGRLSDRFGRRPLVVTGFLFNIAFYTGLALSESFPLLLASAAVAGIGNALLTPALSAAYLDRTRPEERSQVMGLKESAAALGGIAGPLAVAGASSLLGSQGVFLSAAALMGFAALLAALALRSRAPVAGGAAQELPASGD